MTYSAPGAGVDLEAEASRYVIETTFEDCAFEDNSGAGLLAEQATNTFNVSVRNCKFVGTTSWAAWCRRPGFKFEHCLFVGSQTGMWSDADATDAAYYHRCKFTTDANLSPTGVVYFAGGGASRLFDATYGWQVNFSECKFEETANVLNIVGTQPSTLASAVPHFHNCSFAGPNGTTAIQAYGIFSGQDTSFKGSGTVPDRALAVSTGRNFAGFSYDSFLLEGTRYRGNANRIAGKEVLTKTLTYDPPSLAAVGDKTAIQTTTVTGAVVGDAVIETTFTTALAGARIHAWVSAADTVSYYFVNENGSAPLDLGSGTLTIRICKA